MKKLILSILFILMTFNIYAQWNPTGDNTTTGILNIGSYLGIKGGDKIDTDPPRIYMAMQPLEGYYGEIVFRYGDVNKKALIKSTYNSTGSTLSFGTSPLTGGNQSRLTILGNGRIGIGTTIPTTLLDVNGDIKGKRLEINESIKATQLDINGTIRSKEVKIEATGWSDFVFSEDYKLPALSEVESHIKEHKHLPDVPSEKQVIEEGVNVVEMQAKLLQKIEELTLYVIEQEKEIKSLKEKLKNI